MELLAPAGSIRHLRVALDHGADAVYLGGKVFNARKSAANFTHEEIKEAVSLCHAFGASLYVTVNILIADTEWKELKSYIEFLDRVGVDAVIVQDLGVVAKIREWAPQLPIHGSTQMTVSDLAGVEFMAKQGLTRVVLARELSLAEVEEIARHAPIEIEVFIHGAICVCYSGQCQMSSMIGGRSGNRGACAQPCRLPYDLVRDQREIINPNNQKYIMSPKDMIAIEQVERLGDLGVASLKIEGRMKRLDYVAQVVDSYRQILDKQSSPQAVKPALEKTFHRGYTEAYWQDRVAKDMITGYAPNRHGYEVGRLLSFDRKKQVAEFSLREQNIQEGVFKFLTEDGKFEYIESRNGKVIIRGDRCLISTECRPLERGVLYWQNDEAQSPMGEMKHLRHKRPLHFYLEAEIGKNLVLTVMDEQGHQQVVSSDFIVPQAHHKPTAKEQVEKQLGRLGNTPYYLASLEVAAGNYMLPASVLNRLRQQAVELLLETTHREFVDHRPQGSSPEFLPNGKKILANPVISVRVRRMQEVVSAVENGAGELVFGGDSFHHHDYRPAEYRRFVEYCRRHQVQCGLATAGIVREKESRLAAVQWQEMVAAEPDFILIHSYGDYERWLRYGQGIPFVVDWRCNVFNAATLSAWQRLGASRVTLSTELTLQQIRSLGKEANIPLEIYAAGRMELMVTENCVIHAYQDAGGKDQCPQYCCRGNYVLRDRLGKEFPLVTDARCRMHVLNSEITDMGPHLRQLKKAGIDVFRVDAGDLSDSELAYILRHYRAVLAGEESTVEIERPFAQVTRGHLFRGIL